MNGEGRGAVPPEEPTPAVPGYQIVRRLGAGGMGVVYEAIHLRMRRSVALKVIREADTDSETRARFLREARAAANVTHPGLVRVYEIGEHEGTIFYTMDLLDGRSLDRVLAEDGPLPPERAAEIIGLAADAVHAAHQKGLVHRDLKPGNIFEDREGRVHVLDFGLALDRAAGRLTRTGVALGTPIYMAPEQAAGERERLGPRTDVYALGAVLYQLLAGVPPFPEESYYRTLRRVMEEEPLPLSDMRQDLSEGLIRIVRQAMAFEPGDRYATAADLARDCRCYIVGEPVAARPLRGRGGSRGRWVVAGVAAVLLLTALAGVWRYAIAPEVARRTAAAWAATLAEEARAFARSERSRVEERLRVPMPSDIAISTLPALAEECQPEAFRRRLAARIDRVAPPEGPPVDPAVVEEATATFDGNALAARVYLALSDACRQSGDPVAARRQAVAAYRQDPGGPAAPAALATVGDLALEGGDTDAAIRAFEMAIERTPSAAGSPERAPAAEAPLYLGLARAYEENLNLVEALEAYRRAERAGGETADRAREAEGVLEDLVPIYTLPVEAQAAAAGNAAGDARLEIFLALGNTIRVFGPPGADGSVTTLASIDVGGSVLCLGTADLDGDRVEEIVVGVRTPYAYEIRVYRATGGEPAERQAMDGCPRRIAVGEWNGHPGDDVAVTLGPPAGGIALFGIGPGGVFEWSILDFGNTYPWGLAAADLDGDGRDEILAGTGLWQGYAVQAFRFDPLARTANPFLRYRMGDVRGIAVLPGRGDAVALAALVDMERSAPLLATDLTDLLDVPVAAGVEGIRVLRILRGVGGAAPTCQDLSQDLAPLPRSDTPGWDEIAYEPILLAVRGDPGSGRNYVLTLRTAPAREALLYPLDDGLDLGPPRRLNIGSERVLVAADIDGDGDDEVILGGPNVLILGYPPPGGSSLLSGEAALHLEPMPSRPADAFGAARLLAEELTSLGASDEAVAVLDRARDPASGVPPDGRAELAFEAARLVALSLGYREAVERLQRIVEDPEAPQATRALAAVGAAEVLSRMFEWGGEGGAVAMLRRAVALGAEAGPRLRAAEDAERLMTDPALPRVGFAGGAADARALASTDPVRIRWDGARQAAVLHLEIGPPLDQGVTCRYGGGPLRATLDIEAGGTVWALPLVIVLGPAGNWPDDDLPDAWAVIRESLYDLGNAAGQRATCTVRAGGASASGVLPGFGVRHRIVLEYVPGEDLLRVKVLLPGGDVIFEWVMDVTPLPTGRLFLGVSIPDTRAQRASSGGGVPPYAPLFIRHLSLDGEHVSDDDTSPGTVRGALAVANGLAAAGDTAEALALYGRAIQSASTSAFRCSALIARGVLLARADRTADAVADLRAALESGLQTFRLFIEEDSHALSPPEAYALGAMLGAYVDGRAADTAPDAVLWRSFASYLLGEVPAAVAGIRAVASAYDAESEYHYLAARILVSVGDEEGYRRERGRLPAEPRFLLPNYPLPFFARATAPRSALAEEYRRRARVPAARGSDAALRDAWIAAMLAGEVDDWLLLRDLWHERGISPMMLDASRRAADASRGPEAWAALARTWAASGFPGLAGQAVREALARGAGLSIFQANEIVSVRDHPAFVAALDQEGPPSGGR